MAITELFVSGVELMLLGMGIVFMFLAMLIGAIYVMAGLVGRFLPDSPQLAQKPVCQSVDQGSIAAISAAVHQYRIKHK